MVVIAILSVLGLALLGQVGNQQGAALQERTREASFNLAETAFNAEIFVLGHTWPSAAGYAYPSRCAPTSTTVYGCPDPIALARSVSAADPNGVADWSVEVRDNGVASAMSWSNDFLTSQPSWDANGDGRVWVRARAVSRGRPTAVAGLIAQSPVTAGFARNVITAGFFTIGSQGNKPYVDTLGTAAQPSPLAVRCTTPAPSSCLGYSPTKGQVSPDTSQTGYTGAPAVPPLVLADFVARAQRAGTYTASGCPTSLGGAVVVIATGTCTYDGNLTHNSTGAPGILILLEGALTLSGSNTFNGLVYAANQRGLTIPLVTLGGNSRVRGAIQVDGGGGVRIDGSGLLVYDPSGINAATTYLTPQLVKNTWQQLPGGAA